jgi:hypothetical protein
MSERIKHDYEIFGQHMEKVSEDPSYFEYLTTAVDLLPPMTDDCRIAVNIPARQEEARVYDSLRKMFIDSRGGPKQLTRASKLLDPESYEVNIFDNWPIESSHDGTTEQIERFMRDYPYIPIHLISAGLPEPYANVGFARRLMQDVVVMRSRQRTNPAGRLYIASEDADNEGFDPYALSTYVDYLDRHPEAIGARMRMIMNLVTLSQVPHMFMDHRMARLESLLMQRADPIGPCSQREKDSGFCSRFLPPAGVGVAYTAADMLGVGGYRDAVHAEDFSLWMRLHKREIIRGNEGLRLQTLPTYTITSPRRLLASYVMEQNMYGPQSNFAGLHDVIRQPETELVAAAQQKHPLEDRRAYIQSELSMAARYTLHRHASSAQRWRNVGRLMLGLGFTTADYTAQNKDPEVTVHHWDDVEQAILQYQPGVRMQRAMNIA